MTGKIMASAYKLIMPPGRQTTRSPQEIYRFKRMAFLAAVLVAALPLMLPPTLFASTSAAEAAGSVLSFPLIFLWIAILLMLARVGTLIERLGQPAVLGELLIGVALGSLYIFGIDAVEGLKSNEIIHFLAELGVVILLFQCGMETSVKSMMQVGIPSFVVACVGVILPMAAITYVAGPLLLPGLSSTAYLFLGATMTATSVGITARVLQDLNQSHTSEARIIIGAAVIDDVLGLIILAVVAAIVEKGSIEVSSVLYIIFKAVAFLGGGIVVGGWLAPHITNAFSKISSGTTMKFAVVISFGLVFAYIASLVGLAPIVGAFTAGLILTPVYFAQYTQPGYVDDLNEALNGESIGNGMTKKMGAFIEKHSHRHIHEFTEHLGHFLVPIFFVLTGMQVRISALADTRVLLMSLGILVVAMITKMAAGWFAGKGKYHLAVGIGMIPRGEVGLIFANMGKALGVMNDTVFSSIVVVIMLTTLITPPMLAAAFKRRSGVVE